MSKLKLNNILSKKVTRKEFLIHLGILLLTLTGISGLIKSLSNPNIVSSGKIKNGFGSGPYGI